MELNIVKSTVFIMGYIIYSKKFKKPSEDRTEYSYNFELKFLKVRIRDSFLYRINYKKLRYEF